MDWSEEVRLEDVAYLQAILVIDNAIIFMLWTRIGFLERKVARNYIPASRVQLAKPKWMERRSD